MAKIFRTETMSLNGNVLLSASDTDAFEILNTSGSTLMSKATIEGDISSLQAVDVKNESDLSVDVSSLQAADVKNESDLSVDVSSLHANDSDQDTDISSLQAVDVKNESDLSVDVSSLQAVDVKNESDLSVDVSSLQAADVKNESDLSVDISSLHANIESNDVVAISTTLTSGVDTSGSISFGRTFATTPVVVAQLKSSNANDPIIACMVSTISTTAATVAFADQTPNGNYSVELIASIG